jgi:palmitoyltransferase ZDHHC2/15/20
VFWGFHLGDPENKRRRYCLMCNVFKPERCHHCSACNRCVLNMDHHCPWINNCVGFWNRKYFMLMLFYVILTTYFVLMTLLSDIIVSVKWFYGFSQKITSFESLWNTSDFEILKSHSLILIAYILLIVLAGLMTVFVRFHVQLVSENMTTIENLEK